jgi:protein-tyrosine phosphatase
MAEGIFIDLVQKAHLSDFIEIDSAGTSSYHQGELPDKRMRETALRYGITLTSRARALRKQDLHDFDYIAAMDRSVYRAIQELQGKEACRAQVFLMRDHDPECDSKDVPDPYYGGPEGFEDVYQILLRSNVRFLEKILEAK